MAQVIDLTGDGPEVITLCSSDDEPAARPTARRHFVAPFPNAQTATVTRRERGSTSSDRRLGNQREQGPSRRPSHRHWREEATEPENVNAHANSLLTASNVAPSGSYTGASAQKRDSTPLQSRTKLSNTSQHQQSLSHRRKSTHARESESSRHRSNKDYSSRHSSLNIVRDSAKPVGSPSARLDSPSIDTSAAPPISARPGGSGQIGDSTQTTETDSREARIANSNLPGVPKHRPNHDQTTQANGNRAHVAEGMKHAQSVRSKKESMGASTSSLQTNVAAKPSEKTPSNELVSSPKTVVPIRQATRPVGDAQRSRDISAQRDNIDKRKEQESAQHSFNLPRKDKSPNGAVEATQQRSALAAVNNGSIEAPSLDMDRNYSTEDGSPSMARVEEVLASHIANLHEDHECMVVKKIARNRTIFEREVRSNPASSSYPFCTEYPTIPKAFLQQKSPFADLKGIQIPTATSYGRNDEMINVTQEFYSDNLSHKPLRSYLSIPVTPFQSSAVNVPPYTDFVSLRDNVLAENNKKLLYWPYFAEEENEEKLGKSGLWDELEQRFDMVNEQRPRRLLQVEQCRLHRPYTQEFLKEIGIDWTHILFWLLAPESDIAEIEPACKMVAPGSTSDMSLLLKRAPHCEEDFDRTGKKWIMVLSSLPEPSASQLTLAAFACTAFLKLCKFSIWHIARQCDTAQSVLSAPVQQFPTDSTKELTYRTRACRVCTLHNCPYHGEIREEPNSEADSDDDEHSSTSRLSREGSHSSILDNAVRRKKDRALESSSDSESDVINYKKVISVAPRKHREAIAMNGNGVAIQPPKVNVNFWLTKTETHMLHKRRPFYPCSHEGSCEEAHCRCFREKLACEKTCACSPACKRRFRGCSCAKDPKRRVCAKEKGDKDTKCECRLLNRECDADLCGTCGAGEVVDPALRYNDAENKCVNMHIQRNLPKRTILGLSEVQGFGLYVGEKVKKGEYLGEYKGEIITRGEAERRGAIYQHLKTNYLFTLNKEQEIDSTHAGNKFRFINNSCDDRIINCKPNIMLCNGVTRIGMYAERDLKVGEELFFNYGYPKDVTKGFWEKGQGPNGKRKQLVTVKRKKEKTSTLKKFTKESPTKMLPPKLIAEGSNSRSPSKPRRSTSKHRQSSSKASTNTEKPVKTKEERIAQTAPAREAKMLKQLAQGRITSPKRSHKRRKLSATTSSKKDIEEELPQQLAGESDGSVSDDEAESEAVRAPGRKFKIGKRPVPAPEFEGVSEIPNTSDIEEGSEGDEEHEDKDEDDDGGEFEADAVAGHEESSSARSEFEADSDDDTRGRPRDSRLRPRRTESENRRSLRKSLRKRPVESPNVRTRSVSRSRRKRRQDNSPVAESRKRKRGN
ncbi:hypothetical protein BU16DRAFT_555957 [Lophium mytilinum]|uniref:SET domain-containing protein n=1 Tax=Lophium mytilinum TaxID=390894 RepID=A0A6A6R9I6_9PEZI|nr:hypothetical protein BU16DRAFT_555957 [Lophium mytilinum]